MFSEQLADALVTEFDGPKAFIHHARLAGADEVRVLRDDVLRLLFIDEAPPPPPRGCT